MSQSIGPVFGGLITQFFGFHTIFWFLFILIAISLVTILLLLPETLRNVAGNGTVRLTGFQRHLIYNLKPQPDAIMEPNDVAKRKVVIMSILAPLRFLLEEDVFVSLFFGSMYTQVWDNFRCCLYSSLTFSSLVHGHVIHNSSLSSTLQPHGPPSRPRFPAQRPRLRPGLDPHRLHYGPRLQSH